MHVSDLDFALLADYAAAEQYIRIVSAPFGSLSDEQWRHLTESSIRQEEDGKWTMVYDPAIGEPFRAASLAMLAECIDRVFKRVVDHA